MLTIIDHVCIVLRYASGTIVLFEALGGMGVTLTDWKEFVDFKWNVAYKKIVYRKLVYQRTPEMLTEFENFIKVSIRLFTVSSHLLASPTRSRLASYAVTRRNRRSSLINKW